MDKPKPTEPKRVVCSFTLTPVAKERLRASSEHYTREQGKPVSMSKIVEDLILCELEDWTDWHE